MASSTSVTPNALTLTQIGGSCQRSHLNTAEVLYARASGVTGSVRCRPKSGLPPSASCLLRLCDGTRRIAKRLDFSTMTVDQLRVRYEELWFDKPRSSNRTWFIRKIARRLQSLELGGLTDRARQRATTLARTAEVRTTLPRHVTLVPREKPAKPARPSKRDPRLPCVGASVVREYQGRRDRIHGVQRDVRGCLSSAPVVQESGGGAVTADWPENHQR